MKPKVVAICADIEWTKKPFEKEKHYPAKVIRDTYMDLFLKAESENLKFIETNFDWYDKDKNMFRKGWIFDDALGWKQMSDFRADFIFDKSPLTKKYESYKKYFTRKHMILNPHYVEELCSDKMATYNMFKVFVPLSIRVNNKKELLKKLKLVRTDKVVLKPEFGSSAEGVRILDKRKVIKNPPKVKKNTILQEFIECKKTNRFRFHYGVYDLRVVLSQGKVLDSFFRVSKKGVLTSNISTGGKVIFIHKDKIPKGVLKDIKIVESKLKHYNPRLYTMDFVIDKNNKVWLIEMNSKPGFFFYSEYAEHKRQDKFEDALIKAVKGSV
jgi:glutathione synthase/RimK-type ligase-like ATP-grasp enzyme